MSRPSALWRLVLAAERAMPWRSAVLAPTSADRVAQRRWALVPIAVVPVALAATTHTTRADLAYLWANARGSIEGLTLVAAVACLLAALVAGIVTWRRERPHA